jgi:hypothetical protein
MLPMVQSPEEKLAFDTQLMDVYLTGLQAEVEAKLRRVARFREQMKQIDAMGGQTDREARQRAARNLIKQLEEMLETNRTVRETLVELQKTAEAVLRDIEEL